MMPPKLQELVEALSAATRAGALRWALTSFDGVYRLRLEKGLVRLHPIEADVGCVVLDARGETLLEVRESRHERGALVRLYDLVAETIGNGAMEDLLREVRGKLQANAARPEPAKAAANKSPDAA